MIFTNCRGELLNDEVSDTTDHARLQYLLIIWSGGDDSSNVAGYINCIFAIRFFEIFATSQVIASYLFKRRKVRTAQSNAPVNSRLIGNSQERVPQKITTPQGEKVKM